MTVKMFKATKQTHRWRENQKVWVRHEFANHLLVYFRWRGRGRYVTGIVDKFLHTAVGKIVELEVGESFAHRIHRP